MKGRQLMQQLTEGVGLSMEPVPGVPVVEIAGDSRVLIEHHCGITAYGEDHIRVRVSYGDLCVMGECLRIVGMNQKQLVIKGKIRCVKLGKGA